MIFRNCSGQPQGIAPTYYRIFVGARLKVAGRGLQPRPKRLKIPKAQFVPVLTKKRKSE